jgi:hypothetical protein
MTRSTIRAVTCNTHSRGDKTAWLRGGMLAAILGGGAGAEPTTSSGISSNQSSRRLPTMKDRGSQSGSTSRDQPNASCSQEA